MADAAPQGADAPPVPPAPPIPPPPGRAIRLPGRGTTWVREAAGPPGAPTVFLLHGWTATADLNWLPTYGPLSRHFRVLAMDHRGHGRGIHSRRPFRLQDCADDVAAVADATGTDQFIVVGYSMGGPIAQLTWKRHRDRVNGMVLCATSRRFAGSDLRQRAMFGGLFGLSMATRLAPARVRRGLVATAMSRRPDQIPLSPWALDELSRHDPAELLQAGYAIGGFDSRSWIGEIEVPTAVVITRQDMVVAPRYQLALANSIPGATVHLVDGNHAVCVERPSRFVPVLVDACRSVSRRAASTVRG